MPQPILITGATGQVGSALARSLSSAGPLLTPSRTELNLADEQSIRRYIRRTAPRSILNPGAYTAVDKAEAEPELAYRINADAPRILGEEAARLGAPVLHFSTDYVFDGSNPLPYREADPPGPLSVYGDSKLRGEQALAGSGAEHIILRTSWVYSGSGRNFLLTILKLARERTDLRIVADQFGAPTLASDLADAAVRILAEPIRTSGVFHCTAAGETTWQGFASEFLRLAQATDAHSRLVTVLPISTSEYPTPARRPVNSRLNCDLIESTFGIRLPQWRESLAVLMRSLPAAGAQP